MLLFYRSILAAAGMAGATTVTSKDEGSYRQARPTRVRWTNQQP
jgi:hypothetical protein